MTGEELKQIRQNLRFSQSELAEAFGMHQVQMVRWEKMKKIPHSKIVLLALREVHRQLFEPKQMSYIKEYVTRHPDTVLMSSRLAEEVTPE